MEEKLDIVFADRINLSRYRLRPYWPGNNCGHIPDSPRFYIKPENHKARPKILIWGDEACRRFYESPKSFFPEIRFSRNTSRQQRSESREAVASVAQVLLHYTELASLRVGVPEAAGNEFKSLTVEFIAKKAKVGLKRVYRALTVMKRAGYLKIIERFKKEDKRYIGLVAVKSLTLPEL